LGFGLCFKCRLGLQVNFFSWTERSLQVLLGSTVQATSDGIGLNLDHPFSYGHIFEIYPQSETPLLTQIAQLELDRRLGEKPVLGSFVGSQRKKWSFPECLKIIQQGSQRVSTRRDGNPTGVSKLGLSRQRQLLSSFMGKKYWFGPSHLYNFLDDTPTYAPLFRFPFPDGIKRYTFCVEWNMISSWYFGSCEFIYFDTLCVNSIQSGRQTDLNDASLHYIDTFELPHRNNVLLGFIQAQRYKICEDTHVSCWLSYDESWLEMWGIYWIDINYSEPHYGFFTNWPFLVPSIW